MWKWGKLELGWGFGALDLPGGEGQDVRAGIGRQIDAVVEFAAPLHRMLPPAEGGGEMAQDRARPASNTAAGPSGPDTRILRFGALELPEADKAVMRELPGLRRRRPPGNPRPGR